MPYMDASEKRREIHWYCKNACQKLDGASQASLFSRTGKYISLPCCTSQSSLLRRSPSYWIHPFLLPEQS